jgi:hypothetical protein
LSTEVWLVRAGAQRFAISADVGGGSCVNKRVPAVQVSLDGLRQRSRQTCRMACSMVAVRRIGLDAITRQ